MSTYMCIFTYTCIYFEVKFLISLVVPPWFMRSGFQANSNLYYSCKRQFNGNDFSCDLLDSLLSTKSHYSVTDTPESSIARNLIKLRILVLNVNEISELVFKNRSRIGAKTTVKTTTDKLGRENDTQCLQICIHYYII